MGNRVETAGNIFHLAFILHKCYLRSVTPKVGIPLSIKQIQVMHALYSNKINNMKELANETRMSKQYLSNIIKELVKKGVVRRERALHDRRMVMIWPTSAGRTLLENIKKEALVSLADKLVPLHDEDLIVLNSVVTRLTSLIDEEIVFR